MLMGGKIQCNNDAIRACGESHRAHGGKIQCNNNACVPA